MGAVNAISLLVASRRQLLLPRGGSVAWMSKGQPWKPRLLTLTVVHCRPQGKCDCKAVTVDYP